jgi:hypothetical protein
MKKSRSSKRLSLSRETLRYLEGENLRQAAGGTDGSCANSCDPASVRRCPSEACTERLSICIAC